MPGAPDRTVRAGCSACRQPPHRKTGLVNSQKTRTVCGSLIFALLLSVQRQFQRLFFQIQFLHQPGVSVFTDILTFTQLFEGIPLRLKRGQ